MTIESLGGISAALIGAWLVAAILCRNRLFSSGIGSIRNRAVVDPFDIGAAGVTVALLILVGIGVTSPARVLLALAFVTFVPGWAVLGLVPPLKLVRLSTAVVVRVPLAEGMTKVAMAVAVSLTLCTASAQILLWFRLWNPSVLFEVLGGLSLLALAVRTAAPRTFTGLSLDVR